MVSTYTIQSVSETTSTTRTSVLASRVFRAALLGAMLLIGMSIVPSTAQGAPWFSYLDGTASSQVPFVAEDTSSTGGDLNTSVNSSNAIMGTFSASTTQSLTEMRLDTSYAPGWFSIPMGVSAMIDQTFTVDQMIQMTVEMDVADTNGQAGFILYADGVMIEGGTISGGSVAPTGTSTMRLHTGVTYRLVMGFEDIMDSGPNPARMIMASEGARSMRAFVPAPGPVVLLGMGSFLLIRRGRPS
ncbi:MAG: hypothetical protein ACF8GE_03700 [Phycisphaerales bacterium JB043]